MRFVLSLSVASLAAVAIYYSRHKFEELLTTLKFIGISNTYKAVHYAYLKNSLDKNLSWVPGEARSIGNIKNVIKSGGGDKIVFEFDNSVTLEVIFFDTDIPRLTWTPGRLPPPYAIDPQHLSSKKKISLALLETPQGFIIRQSPETGTCHLFVDDLGNVTMLNKQNRSLAKFLSPLVLSTGGWEQHCCLEGDERIYGLGERAFGFNLRGGEYRMWNHDIGGKYGPGCDPLYKCIPVFMGLHSGGSYLAFYENTNEAIVSVGHGDKPDHMVAKFRSGANRVYLIPGPATYCLERYTHMTGRHALPAAWTLGFHQSRWSYFTADEARSIVQGFLVHDLPLSVLHLDGDYMRNWRVFTVDEKNFGDLKTLSADLAKVGVKIVGIIDPGVKAEKGYSVFESGVKADAFCRMGDGSLMQAVVWPGWCAFPDFTNPKARSWWGEQYPELIKHGITGFWHDMNEPAAFLNFGDPTLPYLTQHNVDGNPSTHMEVHNIYGHCMNLAGRTALNALLPHTRVFLLSRSGWAGMQRFSWTWTGDTTSTWETMKQQMGTIMGLGLCGVAMNGPDIGGFFGNPSAELFTRWLQMACWFPFFRNHAALGTNRREPWCFGRETLNISRNVLRLRVSLLPLLYTAAWQTSSYGYPMVRPLFWNLPDSDAVRYADVDDEFLLGDHVLVAPVVEPGTTHRRVIFPPGCWYPFYGNTTTITNKKQQQQLYHGEEDVDVDIDGIPVFARAGSVLPFNTYGDESLEIRVYAPPKEQKQKVHDAGQLYLDKGDGYEAARHWSFTLQWESDNVLVMTAKYVDFRGGYPEGQLDQVRVISEVGVKAALVNGTAVPKSEQDPSVFVLPQFQAVQSQIKFIF